MRVCLRQEPDRNATLLRHTPGYRLHHAFTSAAEHREPHAREAGADRLGGGELLGARFTRADDTDRLAQRRAALALEPLDCVWQRDARSPGRGVRDPRARRGVEAAAGAGPQPGARAIEHKPPEALA